MKKLFLIVFSLFTFTISAQESVLDSIALTEVTVTSQVVDVARDRITPIAFSSVSGAEIDLKAGNLEFVETLKEPLGFIQIKIMVVMVMVKCMLEVLVLPIPLM